MNISEITYLTRMRKSGTGMREAEKAIWGILNVIVYMS